MTKYQNGACFLPDKIDEIAAFIKELASDKKKKETMVNRSLAASKNYTYENAKLYV